MAGAVNPHIARAWGFFVSPLLPILSASVIARGGRTSCLQSPVHGQASAPSDVTPRLCLSHGGVGR